MADMCAAIEENILDLFTLVPSDEYKNRIIDKINHYVCHNAYRFRRYPMTTYDVTGQIKFIRDGKVIVEIDKDWTSMAIKTLPNAQFKINFELNSLPFQVQLNAIDYMQRHQLFSRLIDNSEYETSRGSQNLELEFCAPVVKT